MDEGGGGVDNWVSVLSLPSLFSSNGKSSSLLITSESVSVSEESHKSSKS